VFGSVESPSSRRINGGKALVRRDAGEPLVEIARSYAVSHSTISRLR
jgi:hypothetical protein